MKEQKSQHKIFKADPAKVEAYLLLGDDYDFNEDTEIQTLITKWNRYITKKGKTGRK